LPCCVVLLELGGGIRREDTAEGWLAEGVSRIVLGTVAVEAPELVAALCARHGEAIVVSLDARAGRIAVDGWRKDTPVDVVELAHRMVEMGVRRLIHTDIERDGTLSEPQLDSIARLLAEVKVPVVAAGGISTVEHLGLLEKLGVEGAIIGRALYTGDIDLGEAVMRFGG